MKAFIRTCMVGAAIVSISAASTASADNQSGKGSSDQTQVATPGGVTLQAIVSGADRFSEIGRKKTNEAVIDFKFEKHEFLNPRAPKESEYVYADARGMTLYFYDKDVEAAKSACVADCAKVWPAAVPVLDAKASGDWSIITRSDGAKQWAFKGKPLYTYTQDAKVGDSKGEGAEDGAWHSAFFRPAEGIKRPAGFGVGFVPTVNAHALVDDGGKTLYFFDGNSTRKDAPVCEASSCAKRWLPVSAPELAQRVGDFSIVAGPDSTRQWAYRGKPLYRFGGDLIKRDANGEGLDPRFHVAAVLRYFTPENVTTAYSTTRGPLLAAGSRTLYRRDFSYHTEQYRSVPYNLPGSPVMGRAVGVSLSSCDAKCLKVWHPLKAPKNAVPSGYWEVATRDDGTKQWVYRGYAMYTFAGDTKSGDTNGMDWIDIPTFDEKAQSNELRVVGMREAAALYWSVMEP